MCENTIYKPLKYVKYEVEIVERPILIVSYVTPEGESGHTALMRVKSHNVVDQIKSEIESVSAYLDRVINLAHARETQVPGLAKKLTAAKAQWDTSL